jgi:hypothetical protein
MDTYNEPMKVDLDFANYLGATTELFMNQEAHNAAKDQQTLSLVDGSAQKRRLFGAKEHSYQLRNLAEGGSCTKSVKGGKSCLQSKWHWSLHLYYRPKQYCQEGAVNCMFKTEILEE